MNAPAAIECPAPTLRSPRQRWPLAVEVCGIKATRAEFFDAGGRRWAAREDGRPVVVLPVRDADDVLLDMVAIDLAEPRRFAAAIGNVQWLGRWPVEGTAELRLQAVPLDWLDAVEVELQRCRAVYVASQPGADAGAVDTWLADIGPPWDAGVCVLDPDNADWLDLLAGFDRVTSAQPGFLAAVQATYRRQRREWLARPPRFDVLQVE